MPDQNTNRRPRFNGPATWILTAFLYPLVLGGFVFTWVVLTTLQGQIERIYDRIHECRSITNPGG